MKHFAGLDVSLQETAICIVDEDGTVIREGTAASEPDDLIRWLAASELTLACVGLEAQAPVAMAACWATRSRPAGDLYRDAADEGRATPAMAVKTDRNDAREIAQAIRLPET